MKNTKNQPLSSEENIQSNTEAKTEGSYHSTIENEIAYLIPKDISSSLAYRIKEAYKTVRINLVLSILKHGCKKVVISSGLAAEGKTTTAINLAIALSQINKKVLLIDADLRKPKIHKYLNLPVAPGLSDVLSSQAEFSDAVIVTGYPNLNVLCAGITVPTPAEMLADEAMKIFLAGIEKDYEYVIIDTSPINLVSDSLPIIKETDGVLLVVRQNLDTHSELKKAMASIELIDGKIIGFVFNGMSESGSKRRSLSRRYGYGRDKYGYGYGRYGYGKYGYGYGDKKKK